MEFLKTKYTKEEVIEIAKGIWDGIWAVILVAGLMFAWAVIEYVFERGY